VAQPVARRIAKLVYLKNAGLEKELGDLKDTTQYVMDLYVPQEEGAELKELIDQLNEAEGRIKGLLLDTAKLAVVTSTCPSW
jgi:hypothetical protein